MVDALRSRGNHMTREVNRAHILAAVDCNVSDEQSAGCWGSDGHLAYSLRDPFPFRQG